MLKLFHNDMSVCAQKVRMVLCAKNLEWESEHLNLRAGDQQKPEFLKLNPKSLVPVLVHNDNVILESNVIVEYIEEAFPEPALMPVSLEDRAKVRWWLIQLDAGLHEQVAVISFCLAFRFQVLKQHENEESLQAFINKIPDPNRQAFMKDILPNGPKSPRLKYAVFAYNKILSEMAKSFQDNDWLVGNKMTAADIGFIPYVDRLEQLGLKRWWQDKPQINAWAERVRATDAYQEGIKKWKNPKYMEMMSSLSQESWNSVEPLL
jgi:glutathione S-transferase